MNTIPKHFRDCKHLSTETCTPHGTDVILETCTGCGKEMSRSYTRRTESMNSQLETITKSHTIIFAENAT